jgi:hypothetical protein
MSSVACPGSVVSWLGKTLSKRVNLSRDFDLLHLKTCDVLRKSGGGGGYCEGRSPNLISAIESLGEEGPNSFASEGWGDFAGVTNGLPLRLDRGRLGGLPGWGSRALRNTLSFRFRQRDSGAARRMPTRQTHRGTARFGRL